MSTNVTFNGTNYPVPETGETSWGEDVSALLIALGTFAATATTQRATIRTATTSPITVSSTDYCVVCKLAAPGAVAVTLPAGSTGQLYVILDGTGDAATNNITITPNGSETINGAANYVIRTNNGSVILQFNTTLTRWVVLAADGNVSDSDIASNAAISHSKLAGITAGSVLLGNVSNIPTATALSGDVTVDSSGTTAISAGAIVNNDVNASAAIAYSKLNLSDSITNTDVNGSAAIAYSKLNLSTSILNADINASAAIDRSKLASGTADHVVINNGSGVLSSEATLANTRGGTGTGTYTTGDVLYASATNTLSKRAIGTAGQVLTVVGGVPAWSNAAAGDAVLSAIQTFTQLNTFSGGISVTGGSAANNSIWSASNVLRNRGGTGGWAVDNTSGNAILSATDVGATTIGASASVSDSTVYQNTIRGATQEVLTLNNVASDTNGVFTRMQVRGTTRSFIGASTTLSFSLLNSSATGVCSATDAGAWEWGPSPFAALTQTINGGIAAQCTSSNYHTFFRTSGADTQAPVIIARSATENGSEVYVNFFEGATNAITIGSEGGGIRRNAGDTAYEFYNASDLNLKNITGTYSGGLQQVVNVPVRRFSWKTSPEREHFRFIAQEVQKQIPTAVFEGSDGFLQLGESDFIPIMWNAIQEINAKVETQAAEIQLLKEKQ